VREKGKGKPGNVLTLISKTRKPKVRSLSRLDRGSVTQYREKQSGHYQRGNKKENKN